MFLYYLKLTYRGFWRDKNTFFINLIGLATGLTCFILICLWIQDEWSFDKFHQHQSRLYQVMLQSNDNPDDIIVSQHTPGLLATTLLEEFPEVELATPVALLGNTGILIKEQQRFKAAERYVGKDFFKIFSFPLLEGNKEHLLKEKNQIVLSKSMAQKLFGRLDNIVGETIEWQRNWENVSGNYTVSGVFDDLPKNSTMQFDVLFSFDLFFENKPDLAHWYNSGPRTYITLKEGTDLLVFNDKIEHLIDDKHDRNNTDILFARNYADRYLYGNYENGVQTGGRITYVRLFALIALFILMIACINFMNLSTARASKKLKEVAVKKTVGASRISLIKQYLGEALLISFLGLILAVIAIQFLLPSFNIITNKNLNFTTSPQLIIGLISITLLTGIISGSYPALYLSGFEPAKIFKGTIHKTFGALWLRKGLVIFQFSLSIILIVAVLVIHQQIQFIHSKNLGYDKNNLILFKKEGTIKENMESFLAEVKNISGIVNASTIDGNMTGSYGYTTSIHWEGDNQREHPIRFGVMIVGKELIETLDMELTAGKTFTEVQNGFIFNEKAIALMGLEDPIGKTVTRRHKEYPIVGVVKDFHFASLYEEIIPCYLTLGSYGNNIIAKVQAGEEQKTIAQLDKLFSKFNPGLPFEYKFLDDNYQQLYAAETRVATLSRYFAGIAIFISCLGLFGLAAFATERRYKEIGIRKVLGASISSIITLLSKDFLKLVFIAFFIAAPIAYWGISKWLQNFHYRIDLPWWAFLVAGCLAISITILTVGFQSFKAAIMRPVQSIRNE